MLQRAEAARPVSQRLIRQADNKLYRWTNNDDWTRDQTYLDDAPKQGVERAARRLLTLHGDSVTLIDRYVENPRLFSYFSPGTLARMTAMGQATTNSIVYVFDSYRFRHDGRLTKDGSTVRLPPTEARLLDLFLRSRGRILSHQRIEVEVWPRQTVSYSSLARCVHSLRKKLEGSRQIYIETVPKRGYRFAKHVSTISIDPTSGRLTLDDLEPLERSFFLEGLREGARASAEALQHAVDCFEAVCTKAPGVINAFEELTNCRILQMNRGYIAPALGREKGIEAAEAALLIDPGNVDVRTMQAFLHGTIDGKANQQLARLGAEVEGPMNSAHALIWRSSLEKCAGRLDASLRSAEAAIRCDPFSITASFAHAWSLFLCGNAAAALEVAQECKIQTPWVPYGPAFTAAFAAYLGELELAKEEALRSLDMASGNHGVMILAAYALACAGLADEARRIVDATTGIQFPRAPLSHVAAVHAALGDERRARALLDQARSETEPWYPAAKYDPRLATVFSSAVDLRVGKLSAV